MSKFIPASAAETDELLAAVGVQSMWELYSGIPADLRAGELNIPDGVSESEAFEIMREMAAKNRVFSSIFRGAGAYDHYIPAIVKSVVSKETFLTAYTPYQAEMSQGILQSIFEYQTMICELTGMDVSNASLYDGASAAAEAVAMCIDRKRKKALVSAACNPEVIATVRTYCFGSGTELVLIPEKDGMTDIMQLSNMLDAQTACVLLQSPNYYGVIEDCSASAEIAHENGAKLIMSVNPIAAALLKSPGECDADIAVGEGQPLGMPLSFGGPYLGFMSCTSSMMRQLPGRIVGETTDSEGRRAFVLTLQAREQHIRREKASSNICSNEALCALTAAVYMSAMGADGMAETANQCCSNAHYLASELSKIDGFSLRYDAPFFHEFVTECPTDAEKLMRSLEKHGILGGLPVSGNGILWCATEKCPKAKIDALTDALKKEVRL